MSGSIGIVRIRKRQEGRRKRQEGRGKKEEGRGVKSTKKLKFPIDINP